MKDHVEGEAWVLSPSEEPRDEYKMSRAGNREELGQTLDDA
jgi:hypothetical protein